MWRHQVRGCPSPARNLPYKCKYPLIEIELDSLPCLFAAIISFFPTEKKKLGRRPGFGKYSHLFSSPPKLFCPAPLPWNGISINLQRIEVMMAWNYGCLSRPYSLLCSPSLWVQGSSLRPRPSPVPSFTPSSPFFLLLCLLVPFKGNV